MNSIAVVGLEWLGTLTLFLVFIVFVRYLDYRERMAMIAHGLKPEPFGGRLQRKGSGVLRGGLITFMVGVAVTIGLYNLGYLLPAPFNAVPDKIGPWLLPGLIPTGIGIALVASYYLAPPRVDTDQSAQADSPGTDADQPGGHLRVIEGHGDTTTDEAGA